MVEFGGGGGQDRGQFGEILDPFFAGFDRAGDRDLKPERVAVDIAIWVALRLASHVVGGLEAHRFGDLEDLPLNV